MIFKPVDVDSLSKAVFRTRPKIHTSKPSVFHALLDGEVDDRLFFPIVDASHLRHVRLLVVSLHFFHDVRREVFHRHIPVVGEKLLSFHKNLGHRLSIDFDGTVVAHFGARNFLNQLFEHASFRHLERISVEDERVFLYLHLLQSPLDDRFLKHNRIWREDDCASIELRLSLLDFHLSEEVVISDIRHFHHIQTGWHILHVVVAVEVGGSASNHGSGVGFEYLHSGIGERLRTF